MLEMESFTLQTEDRVVGDDIFSTLYKRSEFNLIYSILIEFKEESYVLQNQSSTIDESIEKCIQYCIDPGIRLFNTRQASELYEEFRLEGDSCDAVEGLIGVWCATFLVEDELVQLHIIETHQ